jgi:acyl-CoA synthetase (AMP-forming)/AMP-acid ligase II
MQMTQGLHRAVQQHPNDIMTICGTRTRTFAEVFGRVSRLAGSLRRLGIEPGDRVALLALNSDDYSDQLLAVAWLGAVVVPMNTRWSPKENAFALADAGAKILLVDDAFAPTVPSLLVDTAGVTIIHTGQGESPEGSVPYAPLVDDGDAIEDTRASGDTMAGIFYTGGTTGTPKGVMLSHANLLTSALGAMASGEFLTPHGRYMHAAPMFHLADLAAWLAQVALGGGHVMVDRFDPALVLEAISTNQVTDALLVPTMIQMVVDYPAIGDYDTSSMRRLIYGASPISGALLDRAMKAFPQVEFTQAYGMTELSPVATMLMPDQHHPAPGTPDRSRSAGRAAPHAEVRVVDPEDQVLPTGVTGEIVVRGGHVMLGYWNRPEETADALRGGWMHTGDAGYLDEDGYLYVVDRIKDMIITGGENVYSVEVENALALHPAVAACAVIGLPDPRWGERVHAVVVLKPGAAANADELTAHTRELIAGYKVPRSLEFTDALPISGAGKVLKRDLRQASVSGPQ